MSFLCFPGIYKQILNKSLFIFTMVIVGVRYVCHTGKQLVFTGRCAEIASCGQWARFDETDIGVPIVVEKKTNVTLAPALTNNDIITSALYQHANGLAMSSDDTMLMDIDLSIDSDGQWNVCAIQPSADTCAVVSTYNDINIANLTPRQIGFCVCWLAAQGE